MNKCSLAVAGCTVLVASVASAQNLMPQPAYERTFSSASLTRGYWFEAPIDFRIVGLSVPDEQGHGLQNVAVLRFNPAAPPPTFATTTNAFDTLEYIVGAPSGTRLPVSIDVFAGDIIGMLGAAGDANIMHNSYGPAGAFQSEIFGRPTELTRMGMQFNLATNRPMEVWQEPTGPVSRVEMYYTEIPAPGAAMLFGLAGIAAARRRRR